MKQENRNQIILFTGLFLLVLQFTNVLETVDYIVHTNRIWIFFTYIYSFLFICGSLIYSSLFLTIKFPWNNPPHLERNKIILFLGIASLSAFCLEYISFSEAYYNCLYTDNLLKFQQNYDYSVYGAIFVCSIIGLLSPIKIGYIFCMQLPFYLISHLCRNGLWEYGFLAYGHKIEAIWIVLLIFVIIWSILCHRQAMLEHWKIKNRKELILYLGISIIMGFTIHYFLS